MKIISVETPKVLDYYVSEKYKELIKDKCKKGYCEVPADNSHLLYTVIDYDPDVFAMLNLYLSKIEKVESGNTFLYEYELNVTSTIGDKDFVINTEKESMKCSVDNIHMEGNTSIIIIFKIK